MAWERGQKSQCPDVWGFILRCGSPISSRPLESKKIWASLPTLHKRALTTWLFALLALLFPKVTVLEMLLPCSKLEWKCFFESFFLVFQKCSFPT